MLGMYYDLCMTWELDAWFGSAAGGSPCGIESLMLLMLGLRQTLEPLDVLCGVTCVTSVTMQGSMGTVSDTDSEVSTANAAPTGAYGRVGCDEMEYTGQVFRPDVRHCCRTLHL